MMGAWNFILLLSLKNFNKGRVGVEGLSKKDSWIWTTVWWLWWRDGKGSIKGLNGNGKNTIKKAQKILHIIQYIDGVLHNCTPETYLMVLTNVTTINSIKNKKIRKGKKDFSLYSLPWLIMVVTNHHYHDRWSVTKWQVIKMTSDIKCKNVEKL